MPTASPNSFDNLYMQLNAGQRSAVDHIEGPVMVIAGPGTGKTTILTLRIANILKQTDTAPQNILALTFTESGAYAMRRKLFDIIGSSAYKVNIHTYHGFAAYVIEQYPDYFSRIIGSRVITAPEQITIVKNILESKKIKLLRPYGDQDYYVSPVLREIQVLKRENISPLRFQKSLKDVVLDDEASKAELEKQKKQNEKNIELAFVYSEYEKALQKEKYYDFEDMLLELIRAMEDEDNFKLILQENYQYILADEHQDANASQNRILELLSDFHDSPNLFIVGDDKQAIYRFQGATLENFLYFSKKYRDAVIIDLEHNYRSHQGILDASHSLIENNPKIPGRERKRLVSLQLGSTPIFVTECGTFYEELDFVAKSIEKMIEKGANSEEIVILYRDNKHADLVAKSLKDRGIPHKIESDHNILHEPDVVKLLYFARVTNDPSDDEAVAKALFMRELGADPSHVSDICREATRQKKSLHSLVSTYDDTAAAYEKIKAWAHEARIMLCTDFIQKMIQDSGMLEDVIRAENSLERLDSIQAFYDHVVSIAATKRTFYLADLIAYLAIADDHGVSMKRRFADHVTGVRLMTAHRAKGLEFGHVFIVHAGDSIWGNRSSRNLFTIPIIEHARNVGRIEDERRLFYVAMTRARETVNISYSRTDNDKELLPSQFISEIDPMFINFDELAGDTDEAKVLRPHIILPRKKDPANFSILDEEFVRNKYLAQPLSVTHLNNYLDCPWKYFFVNLIRIPQAQTKHQMYGTAVHAVLRTFFNAYKDDRTLGNKEIIDLFRHALEMQPLAEDDRRESFEKGKRALTGYFEQYDATWPGRLLTEYAASSSLDVILNNSKKEKVCLELTGKLDKIEFIDDHNVNVVDYKTGKPKSRNEIEGKTKTADGNYKRQLVFYKILLSGEDRKKGFNMVGGEIDFIEPNERGIYKKEKFDIAREEVEMVTREIADMANDIVSLGFKERTCKDKDCEYCKLGGIIN